MELSVTPSKSTSRYSKSSSSSSIPTTPATRKSMEEVRDHISLPNLHHPAVHSAFNGGINLPDFIHNDPYTRHDPHHHQHSHDYGAGTGFPFGCRSPPSATVLSLKSWHLDHFLEKNQEYSARSKPQAQFQSQLACAENPSFVSSSLCKKRVHLGNNGDDATDERRHQRLIKNRESAARSRARRQAYTDELEQKMEELKKENANLRRELEKVGFGEAAAAAPAQRHNSRKGHSLHRALTAVGLTSGVRSGCGSDEQDCKSIYGMSFNSI